MERETSIKAPSGDGTARREGGAYRLEPSEIEAYQRDGYITLPGLLTEGEVAELEAVFDRFMAGEFVTPEVKKDFCDMSQGYGVPFEQWRLVNAMLPREYFPQLQDNLLEQRAASVARQLLGEDMVLDYDQLLLKRPSREGAQFAWHQDQAYWPQDVPDPRTVTVSLALNDADVSNGCLRVVPGSHREADLRPHRPLGGSRDEAHALTVDLKDGDQVVYLPLRRGDVTVHDERIVHGSDGNHSDHPRKTYVVAFRSQATVDYERSIGFTHSHNTEVNWDTWISKGKAAVKGDDGVTTGE
jgi:hypothetical protein